MAKDVMRATSCSLCDPSPCDLRIRSAWVDEAHLAGMWSIWALMDKLDCSTTPNTRKVLTCSAPGTTGPSGLMLDLCRLLVITSSLVLGWFKRRLFLAAHADGKFSRCRCNMIGSH